MKPKMTFYSQCYNRAHVWSWELYKKYHNGRRIQTGKMWVFFTRKYINAYDGKWWFHIAPYLTHRAEIKMMDRTFFKSPTSVKKWTDKFVLSGAKCPRISKYSQFDSQSSYEHCYTISSSVFYWQPWQVESYSWFWVLPFGTAGGPPCAQIKFRYVSRCCQGSFSNAV